MGKRNEQFSHGAHIKRNTEGTSNELSFSVLDAAKNALDSEEGNSNDQAPKLGKIPFFSLGKRKKLRSTPEREKGILLPSGDFVSTEGDTVTTYKSIESFSGISNQKGQPSDLSLASPALSISSKPDRPALDLSSSSLEVKRRKKKRLRRRILIALTIFIVVGSGIGVAISAASNVIETNNSIRDRILKSIESIETADETLLELDRAVTDRAEDISNVLDETATATPSSQRVHDEFSELEPRIEEAVTLLDQAAEDLRDLQPNIRDNRDQGVADQARKAIEARKAMFSIGSDFIRCAEKVEQGIDQAYEAWQYVISGDNKAREAAAFASETTIENARKSIDLTKQSISDFDEAQSRFDTLAQDFPDEGFDAYQAYVSKKIEALQYAIASDQAYIDRNKEQAIQQNDAYTAADAEATALAGDLKGDPATIIADDFEPELRAYIEEYSTQRLLAGETDAFIRDYLGENVK